jgi:hypothetical protein
VPILIVFAAVLITVVAAVALAPIGLVQRYRAGTARRVARRWVATLNIAALSLSVTLFLAGAAVSNYWAPGAFVYSLGGVAAGILLGFAGLALTRWESSPGRLHYTPNRQLVLAITLIVVARLAYGLWRLWHGWQIGSDERVGLVQSSVPGSLAVGALVLGYTLSYWIGVRRQIALFDKARR